MNHEDDGKYEPTRFAFFRDGDLVAGDLSDWAKMWEGDYYAGDTDLSTRVWVWKDASADPCEFRISVERQGVREDDWIPHMITIPGLHDVVVVSVDGRN